MAATGSSTLADEYATLTERCGLVNRSERGKLALSGADAVEFLNGQVTNELVGLLPGEGRYAAFLTHKGKMLGDLRILVAAEPPREARAAPVAQDTPVRLLLDCERVALQALFDMIRRFKVGYEVELHKRTLERALFSLIGPATDELLASAFPLPARGLSSTEHAHISTDFANTPVRLIRTDAGIDLLFDSSAADAVRAGIEDAGAVAVGEAAAEVVRVERGRPRYGVDLDESTIPQEAGLNERAVSFTKGCYVGQETVARLYYKGKPNRHLRGLRLSAPVPSGAELYLDDRLVGRLGSSVVSPALGPIGLALVRREAEPGTTLHAEGVSAEVSELPFQRAG